MEERSAKRQKMATSTPTASSSGVSDFYDDSWLSEDVLANISKAEEEFTKSQANSQAEKKEESEEDKAEKEADTEKIEDIE